ncbi:MAG: hypothetical protein AB7T63_00315 [Planctomycetota bacterium]
MTPAELDGAAVSDEDEIADDYTAALTPDDGPAAGTYAEALSRLNAGSALKPMDAGYGSLDPGFKPKGGGSSDENLDIQWAPSEPPPPPPPGQEPTPGEDEAEDACPCTCYCTPLMELNVTGGSAAAAAARAAVPAMVIQGIDVAGSAWSPLVPVAEFAALGIPPWFLLGGGSQFGATPVGIAAAIPGPLGLREGSLRLLGGGERGGSPILVPGPVGLIATDELGRRLSGSLLPDALATFDGPPSPSVQGAELAAQAQDSAGGSGSPRSSPGQPPERSPEALDGLGSGPMFLDLDFARDRPKLYVAEDKGKKPDDDEDPPPGGGGGGGGGTRPETPARPRPPMGEPPPQTKYTPPRRRLTVAGAGIDLGKAMAKAKSEQPAVTRASAIRASGQASSSATPLVAPAGGRAPDSAARIDARLAELNRQAQLAHSSSQDISRPKSQPRSLATSPKDKQRGTQLLGQDSRQTAMGLLKPPDSQAVEYEARRSASAREAPHGGTGRGSPLKRASASPVTPPPLTREQLSRIGVGPEEGGDVGEIRVIETPPLATPVVDLPLQIGDTFTGTGRPHVVTPEAGSAAQRYLATRTPLSGEARPSDPRESQDAPAMTESAAAMDSSATAPASASPPSGAVSGVGSPRASRVPRDDPFRFSELAPAPFRGGGGGGPPGSATLAQALVDARVASDHAAKTQDTLDRTQYALDLPPLMGAGKKSGLEALTESDTDAVTAGARGWPYTNASDAYAQAHLGPLTEVAWAEHLQAGADSDQATRDAASAADYADRVEQAILAKHGPGASEQSIRHARMVAERTYETWQRNQEPARRNRNGYRSAGQIRSDLASVERSSSKVGRKEGQQQGRDERRNALGKLVDQVTARGTHLATKEAIHQVLTRNAGTHFDARNLEHARQQLESTRSRSEREKAREAAEASDQLAAQIREIQGEMDASPARLAELAAAGASSELAEATREHEHLRQELADLTRRKAALDAIANQEKNWEARVEYLVQQAKDNELQRGEKAELEAIREVLQAAKDAGVELTPEQQAILDGIDLDAKNKPKKDPDEPPDVFEEGVDLDDEPHDPKACDGCDCTKMCPPGTECYCVPTATPGGGPVTPQSGTGMARDMEVGLAFSKDWMSPRVETPGSGYGASPDVKTTPASSPTHGPDVGTSSGRDYAPPSAPTLPPTPPPPEEKEVRLSLCERLLADGTLDAAQEAFDTINSALHELKQETQQQVKDSWGASKGVWGTFGRLAGRASAMAQLSAGPSGGLAALTAAAKYTAAYRAGNAPDVPNPGYYADLCRRAKSEFAAIQAELEFYERLAGALSDISLAVSTWDSASLDLWDVIPGFESTLKWFAEPARRKAVSAAIDRLEEFLRHAQPSRAGLAKLERTIDQINRKYRADTEGWDKWQKRLQRLDYFTVAGGYLAAARGLVKVGVALFRAARAAGRALKRLGQSLKGALRGRKPVRPGVRPPPRGRPVPPARSGPSVSPPTRSGRAPERLTSKPPGPQVPGAKAGGRASGGGGRPGRPGGGHDYGSAPRPSKTPPDTLNKPWYDRPYAGPIPGWLPVAITGKELLEGDEDVDLTDVGLLLLMLLGGGKRRNADGDSSGRRPASDGSGSGRRERQRHGSGRPHGPRRPHPTSVHEESVGAMRVPDGEVFEQLVQQTFRKKAIRYNERVRDSSGTWRDIDIETKDAVIEVGLSLAGKLNQLKFLSGIAASRGKSLVVVYGPKTRPGTVRMFRDVLRRVRGARVSFVPHDF